jgi:hypothetical protein
MRELRPPHQRRRQRQRHEGQEQQVDRREQVRGHARAQQVVQHGRRVPAEGDGAVELQQPGVGQLRTQEGQRALEVAVRDVRRVEAGEADGDAQRPLARPPLAQQGPDVGAAAGDQPGHEVGQDEQRHDRGQPHPCRPRDPVGVAQRDAERGRDEQRQDRRAHGKRAGQGIGAECVQYGHRG